MQSQQRKRVIILGSTGSIGTSALKVARDLPDRMEVVALAAAQSVDALAQQAVATGARHVAIYDERRAGELLSKLPAGVKLYAGAQGLLDLVTEVEADMVLIAIVGTAGLRPALAAIECGRDLAVASKEILVMAGEAVMGAAARKGVRVLPVDSEHNAIFQCLNRDASFELANAGERQLTKLPHEIRRIILTASGGPFRETPNEKFASITPEQALKHPTWNMGPKITIDSATLFNKGLEMIEAHWLFGVEMKRVEVVIHPQSIVHSMVEFADGSVLAQLSHSNMCFPIQYAITWPDRVPNSLPPLDFGKLAELKFARPRYDDFPALGLARRAGETGGTLPAVLNAANEIAVSFFLEKRMSFPQIWQTVERVMNAHESIAQPGL